MNFLKIKWWTFVYAWNVEYTNATALMPTKYLVNKQEETLKY